MGKAITITVRLAGTEFEQDYEVEPERPLVELVRRVAKDQDVPLVTRQGRPLAWEAEGPDWREGKTGRTDLTRTQPLDRIAARMLEEHGRRAPLFMISVTIPGAAEALTDRAEEAKRAEIEARLAQREAERQAELAAMEPGLAEDEDIVTERVPAITDHMLEDSPTEPMGAPPQRPGAIDIRDPSMPSQPRKQGDGRPVEQRIRRADGPGTQERRARRPGQGGGKRRKSKKKAGVLWGLPMGAVIGIAAGGVLMLGLLVTVIAVTAGGDKPEPTPTSAATVTPLPDVVIDIPVATPPPTPAPTVATPPPVEFETFYSKGSVDRNNGKSTGAQISSFAKPEVKLGYKVNLAGPGSHTVGLKGRFSLKVSDSGSTLSGASTKSCRPATVGKDTRVSVHWTGNKVSAYVAGKRCGPVSVSSTSGFPAWQFTFDQGVTITGLWAKAPAEE